MSSGVSTVGLSDILLLSDTGAFSKRVAELKASKESALEAFDKLRIGEDATKAYADVKKLKDEYEEKMKGINAEADDIRARAGEVLRQSHSQASDLMAVAEAKARALKESSEALAAALIAEAKAEKNETKIALKAAKDAEKAAKKNSEIAEAVKLSAEKQGEEAAAAQSRAEAMIANLRAVLEG